MSKETSYDIKGVKAVPGTAFYVVRSRESLGVPDYRKNPTDVVRAKLIGYSEEYGEFAFDDGRTAEAEFLVVRKSEVEDLVFPKESQAKEMAMKEGVAMRLVYARDDYEEALLTSIVMGTDDATFTSTLKNADPGQLNWIIRLLGSSPFKAFKNAEGVSLDIAERKRIVKESRDEYVPSKRRTLYTNACETMKALKQEFGEAVTVSNKEADRKPKEKKEKVKKSGKKVKKSTKKAAA